MRDAHPVVSRTSRDRGRPHAGALGRALGGVENGEIGRPNLIHQMALDGCRIATRRAVLQGRRGYQLAEIGRQRGDRQAASHFTGVVAHPCRSQDGQTQPGIGENGILIVRADDAGVGADGDFERVP